MRSSLLMKANLRKTKGLSIGLTILIILAACFLNVVLMIALDFNQNARNVAERLNTEDAYLLITNAPNVTDADLKAAIDSTTGSDVKEFEISRMMTTFTEVPFGDGTFAVSVNMAPISMHETKINNIEIIEEDDSITGDYIYLPYQYYTGGDINLGDEYKFKILSNEYTFKVKGFLNSITTGSNNAGVIQTFVNDAAYDRIREETAGNIASIYVKFKLNDGVNSSKFINSFSDTLQKTYGEIAVFALTLDEAIFARTFLGMIFSAILLAISAIVLIIVILMLANNISNFMRENIRSLGALKAIGYTSGNISGAFIAQFVAIDIIGSFVGIFLSIFMMQAVGNIMLTQSGVPYEAKFNVVSAVITLVMLLAIVIVSLYVLLGKIKKLQPIVALREGRNTGNLKRTGVHLDKTKLPVNVSLALKTSQTNFGQNVVAFLVTFGLIYMTTMALVLYQNFVVEPKLSLLTFESCDGTITTDEDENREIYHYLASLDGVERARMIATDKVSVGDAQLMTYIVDDPTKMDNQDVAYEGSLPANADEVAISGKFGTTYDYPIGSQIKLIRGQREASYKVSGYIQTTNNNGQEMVITEQGMNKLVTDAYPKMYYFNLRKGKDIEKIFEKLRAKFGKRIESTSDFAEVVKGALKSFQMISVAIVVLISVISLFVILLVLYMLIKTLVSKRKKEYGILKALGYTSGNIVFQNAFSFMPVIILAVAVSLVVSYFTMNSFIGLVFGAFGVMKVTFSIPVGLMIVFGLGFVLISFWFAVMLSRKIKKIEPVKLLVGE